MADAPRPSRYPAAEALEPSDAERRVLDAAAGGEAATFAPAAPEAERTLRAELLTALLLGLRDDWAIDPRGLRVSGAVVAGRFDLSYARNPATGGPAAPSFRFTDCTFAEAIDLTAACLDHVVFEDCTLPRLDAPSLRCARVVLEWSRFDGAIDLGGAGIDGPFDASFARGVTRLGLENASIGGDVRFAAPWHRDSDGKPAELRLVDAHVGGGVYAGRRKFGDVTAIRCRIDANLRLDDVEAQTVDIAGARIGGQLGMNGAKLRNKGGDALSADGAEILGDAFLRTTDPKAPFEAEGEIRLLGAKIGGVLVMNGAKLRNADGTVLHADRAEIVGDAFLDTADPEAPFEADGEIRLLGAKIGGQLVMTGAKLRNANGDALSADHAEISGSAILETADAAASFEADGEIRLLGAKIGGQLAMSGAKLRHLNGYALNADGAEIVGSTFLRTDDPSARFEAEGAIGLLGGKIGGQLNMVGANLRKENGCVIDAGGLEVVGHALLHTANPDLPFQAEGEIRLPGAKIGGQLAMVGAKLRNAGGTTLYAAAAHVGQFVFLRDDFGVRFSSIGLLRFDHARLGGLDASGAQVSRSDNEAEDGGSTLRVAFARIDGPLHLRASATRAFACRGRIDLTGVRVDGEVDLRGGVFVAEDGSGEDEDRKAICLDRSDLRSTVRFGRRGRFTSVVVGAASLDGAHLAKDLELTGGLFRVDVADDPLTRNPDARPSDDAVARRKVGVCLSLRGARVDGLLHTKGFGTRAALRELATRLAEEDGAADVVATLAGVRRTALPDDSPIGHEAALHPNGLIDLHEARFGALDDHPQDGWPARDGLLDLDGCTYGSLALLTPPVPGAVPAPQRRASPLGDAAARIWKRRLAWLDRQWPGSRPGREHFKPQPFEQLAKVLRAMGHGHDADRIAVEKRRFALRCRADRGVAFALNWILARTSDFGYAPGRAILSVVAAVVLGSAAMAAGVAEGGLALKDGEASVAADQPLALLLYAVDAFLPFLSLSGTPELDREATHWGFQLFLLAYNLAGVVLTSILVVTLTGLLRQD